MVENTCTKKLFTIRSSIESAVSRMLEKELVSWYKEDGTPVSNIDILLQQAISEIILSRYPNDHLIAEEGNPDSLVHKTSHSWVIDPIDGTENFINKKAEFGISVGLMNGNHFTEAFLIFPGLKETYYASKGEGILFNGDKFEMGKENCNETQEIILCSKTVQRLRPVLESKGYKVGFYKCATYSLLQLLKRKAIIFHTINTMIYDVGPMAFILSESEILSYGREKKEISYDRENPRIPFFVSATGNNLPENIYEQLILQ